MSTLERTRDEQDARAHSVCARGDTYWLTRTLNNLSLGLVTFNEDERIVVCNGKYIQMYGLCAETVKPGLYFRDLIRHRKLRGTFKGDVDDYCTGIINTVAQGTPSHALFITPDGRTIQIINHPLPEGGWVATHEDVTQRQCAEKERDDSRKFLDLIVEAVPVTLIVKEVGSARYTLLNRAAEKLWGIRREKAIGRTAADIFEKETADRITAHDELTISGGVEQADITHEINTPANGKRMVSSKKLVLFDSHGRPQYLLGVIQDVTASVRNSERIKYMAHHDLLTGLGNRALFMERTEDELTRLRSSGDKFAIVMLDLDRFKEVNDTLGHGAGDELLKQAAARLKKAVRETDVLGRLGGDEFAIIQRSAHEPVRDATMLAERVVEAFAQPFELEGSNVAIGVSLGISLAPCDGDSAGDLIKKADLALYQTKSNGRNGYSFFDTKLATHARERHNLERDLRAAIEQRELHPYFQPIVDTHTRELRGFEALARWPHPVRGFVAPDQFIPLAEETGLIATIGDMILQKACAVASTWPEHIKLAVNISPLQLKKPEFLNIVMCALVESGLTPERLELELTEGVLLESHLDVLPLIKQLKKLGVAIVLDDFGTGYSSLNYLTRFPFSKIKIDKSFTQNMTRKSECAAIVSAVMAIAYSLDITVVAEGVETEQQLELLCAAGVQAVQGYLLGRPAPADELRFDYRPEARPNRSSAQYKRLA